MIIAVENSLAQHLHINSQVIAPSDLLETNVWTIRVTGEFMIIMNNLMSLPIIVRYLNALMTHDLLLRHLNVNS